MLRFIRDRQIGEKNMTEKQKKLPIGIERFDKLRSEDYYCVDKTGMIRELFEDACKVKLFTRPGRFGKSLNLDMLRNFLRTVQTENCLRDWRYWIAGRYVRNISGNIL